jgi:3-oxoacyl-[acyl-carrier protein] reductase
MDLGLTGKVAMVAGASRGLGYGVARILAAEGAQVSMASRDTSAVVAAAKRIGEETGGTTYGVAADARSREALEAWSRTTVERFGGIDILITNTGGPPTGAASSFEDDAWRSGFELIVLSVIRMVRAVLPSMEERGGGSILMLTSSSVKEPIVNLGLSNVLRASVAALAKTLANELAPRRIRVNQLIPGRIATDRLNELDTINSQRQGISLSDYRNRAQTTIPLGRYGTPNEFACAAAFLVSGAASYISGATLQVDGGLIRSVL